MNSMSPALRLLLFIVLMLTCMGMGSVASVAVGIVVFNLPLESLQALLSDPQPEHAVALMWMNNITQLFTFLLPAVFFLYLFRTAGIRTWLGSPPAWMLIAAPVMVIAAGGIIDLSGYINKALIPENSWLERMTKPMEDMANNLTELILGGQGLQLIIAFMSVAIIPAICEELAFRGVMQPLMARVTRNAHTAVWLTALVFSLFHMQFYGFIPRLLLGALLGYLVLWSGSVWVSVFAHFVNNATAFFLFRTYGSLETPADSTQNEWYFYVVTTALFVLLLLSFLKRSRWPWLSFDYLGITRPGSDVIR